MTLTQFRKLVKAEFGHDLQYMTPANAREFLARVEVSESAPPPRGRIKLDEPEGTYEGIVHDFLRQSLEMPSDQAVIRLWLFCLELANASLNDMEAARFEQLFAGLASEGE